MNKQQRTMITFPCAKINLGLNIVEKRPDGYHNIETVFFPVNIADALSIHEMPENYPYTSPCCLKVTGTDYLCNDDDNLVIKAYKKIAAEHEVPRIFANLHKNIPSQAGMGGGSSDAAYMIRLLNDAFSIGMTQQEMERHAAQLGADCAIFVSTDPTNPKGVYATGIGEILSPLPETWNALNGKWMALIKPDVAVSTKQAFAGITPRKPIKNCRDIVLQPIETWKEELKNDFEESIFPQLPILAEVKQLLYDNGAVYAAMSGSGSTIFGIFDEKPTFVTEKFSKYYNYYYKISY